MARDHDQMEAASRRVIHIPTKSGREILVGSMEYRNLVSIRERCLADYRREQIKAWTENADLIPEDKRDDWIRDAFKRASEITVGDLPEQSVKIPRNGELVSRKVAYDVWWASEDPRGILYSIWLAAKNVEGQEDITLQEIEDEFTGEDGQLETARLDEAGNLVGQVSEPRLESARKKKEDRKTRRESRRNSRGRR